MDEQQEIESLNAELQARQRYLRGPVRIREALNQLMARRGYGQTQGKEQREAAWRRACGEKLAAHTRVGKLSRGALTVFVRDSLVMQELKFQEQALVQRLAENEPDMKVRSLRFRIGAIN